MQFCLCFDAPHLSPKLYPGHIASCVPCSRQVEKHSTIHFPQEATVLGLLAITGFVSRVTIRAEVEMAIHASAS